MRRSEPISVERYGLYLDESDHTWWLLQQGVHLNAVGYANSSCPFVMRKKLVQCPHRFSLYTEPFTPDELVLYNEYKQRLAVSPILQFFDMGTISKNNIIYILTTTLKDYASLMYMQNMSNPSINSSDAAYLINPARQEKIARQLSASNLASYMVYELGPDHTKLISDLSMMTIMKGGKLILAGSHKPMFKLGGDVHEFDNNLSDFIHRCGDTLLRKIGNNRLKELMRT